MSLEYLALVEKGLRNYTKYVFAMGGNSLKSRETWRKVQPWRKREAYIALVRHVRGRPSYHQWDNFLWSDYLERQKAARTFELRHLPLSNARDDNYFEHFLSDPPHWNEKEVNSKKKKKSSVSSAASSSNGTGTKTPNVIMVFDVETGELVPLEKHD